MTPRTLVLALAISTLAAAPSARADDGPRAGLDGGARRFAFLDAPPPAPVLRAPAPEREGDEYARKSWEAFPEVGFGAPFCRGTSLGAGHCGDTGNGPVLGGGALYRLSPYVGLGAVASFASFQVDSPATAGAFSSASF